MPPCFTEGLFLCLLLCGVSSLPVNVFFQLLILPAPIWGVGVFSLLSISWRFFWLFNSLISRENKSTKTPEFCWEKPRSIKQMTEYAVRNAGKGDTHSMLLVWTTPHYRNQYGGSPKAENHSSVRSSYITLGYVPNSQTQHPLKEVVALPRSLLLYLFLNLHVCGWEACYCLFHIYKESIIFLLITTRFFKFFLYISFLFCLTCSTVSFFKFVFVLVYFLLLSCQTISSCISPFGDSFLALFHQISFLVKQDRLEIYLQVLRCQGSEAA